MEDHVQVEVDGLRLARVVIRSGWQDQGGPEELAAAIGAAIRSQLPPPARYEDHPNPSVRTDFTMADLETFMDLHRKWRAKLMEFKAREAAGEFRGDTPSEIVDPQQRLSITFDGDGFEAVHFNPKWAADASLQALSDAILDLTDGVDLMQHSARSAAFAEVRALSAAAHDYAN